ncbi:MAG: family 20 glycosylhydrolase [Armatimonadota bacterium]
MKADYTPSPRTPGLPWQIRAVQLDLARQMETVDFVCRYIDFIAANGYNTLQLYLEGRVRTASFPFRPAAESYTLEEMARIVEHGKGAGIEVVPAIATLGHCEQFLSVPEMAHLAEERDGHTRFGSNYKSTLCPSLDATYDFLRGYISELAQVFTAPHIHVGCDEAWNLGFCHLCNERWQREGLGKVFSRHIARVEEICSALGKRMWIWDDMFELFPEELPNASRSLVMCHWQYDELIESEGIQAHFADRARHNWLATYDRMGFDALICPWVINIGNTTCFTDYARRHGVLGGVLTQWEEKIIRQHPESFPGVVYAGKLWSGNGYTPEQTWEEAIASLLPGIQEPLATAVSSLLTIPRVYPRSGMQAFLMGKLTGGESTQQAAVKSATAVIRTALKEGVPEQGRDILEELVTGARAELLHWNLRELLLAIYDTRRPAEDLPRLHAKAEACQREIADLIAVRAPQHDLNRPGMYPQGGGKVLFERLQEMLKPAWERLERATTEDDWVLILRLLLPEIHGAPRMKITAQMGEESQVLIEGGYKPQERVGGCYYTVQVPFTSTIAPDGIRIEVWGYGGQGIAFLEMQNRSTTLMPARIRTANGEITNPEAVLRDDALGTYLGHPSYRDAMLDARIADCHAVLELDMSAEANLLTALAAVSAKA